MIKKCLLVTTFIFAGNVYGEVITWKEITKKFPNKESTTIDEFFYLDLVKGQTNDIMKRNMFKIKGYNAIDHDGNDYLMRAILEYDYYGDFSLWRQFELLIDNGLDLQRININGDSLLSLLIKKHQQFINGIKMKKISKFINEKNLSKYINVLRLKNASYGKFTKLQKYDLKKQKNTRLTQTQTQNLKLDIKSGKKALKISLDFPFCKKIMYKSDEAFQESGWNKTLTCISSFVKANGGTVEYISDLLGLSNGEYLKISFQDKKMSKLVLVDGKKRGKYRIPYLVRKGKKIFAKCKIQTSGSTKGTGQYSYLNVGYRQCMQATYESSWILKKSTKNTFSMSANTNCSAYKGGFCW